MKTKYPMPVYYGWLRTRVIIPAGSTLVPATNIGRPAKSAWWLRSIPRAATLRPCSEAPLAGLARGSGCAAQATPPPPAYGMDEENLNRLRKMEFKSWKNIYGILVDKQMLLDAEEEFKKKVKQ